MITGAEATEDVVVIRSIKRDLAHNRYGITHVRFSCGHMVESESTSGWHVGDFVLCPKCPTPEQREEDVMTPETEVTMKAISVRQPWAGLIFDGKNVENRSWNTHYRGPLLIHATSQRDHMAVVRGVRGTEATALTRKLCAIRGAIIGQVTLAECRHSSTSRDLPWGEHPCWHWILIDPVIFAEPIPTRGRLGLWNYAGTVPATHAKEGES